MLGHCILAVVTVPHVWLKLQVQHRALWGGLQSWRPRERSVDFAVVQLNCMLLRQDRHTVATEVGPQRHPMTELCAYVQFCCNLIFKFTVAKWYHVMLWCHRLHHHHLHRLFVHWDSYNEQWIIWQYNMTERHIKVLWQLPKLCVKLVSIGATLQPKVLVNRFHRLIRDLRLGGWQLWPSELQLEAFWDKGPRARWSYWGWQLWPSELQLGAQMASNGVLRQRAESKVKLLGSGSASSPVPTSSGVCEAL